MIKAINEKKDDRNKSLIKDYLQIENNQWKHNTSFLIGKYKISNTRIYKILNAYSIPNRTNISLSSAKRILETL